MGSFAKQSRLRRIALVDCNNFYASCERAFNLSWVNRPIGVLSNNDGCIVARSNELKEAGIPMGAPLFQIRSQLEAINAVVVSSNYALYGDMSSRVMDTLAQFTPDLEVYSIDEAWLDLTGFQSFELDGYGRTIANTVRQNTGIPVSIGIAQTKVLAKIANRICKKWKIPGYCFNLGNEKALDEILTQVAVEDIWGIAHRWGQRLNAMGIENARQLRDSDTRHMRKGFSVVMERLILELRGISCLEFEDVSPKKQIIASRSFGERVEDLESLLQAVSTHATRAAEKLRAQQSLCGAIQASIRTGRHNPKEEYFGRSALLRFDVPTSDTRRLIQAACHIVKGIYRQGPRYAKAGVMLIDLSPSGERQISLFAGHDDSRSAKLMETLDHLNQVYGRNTVFFGRSGVRGNWRMRRERMTPRYTTCWDDIPIVRSK